ncbi:hypothetical protein Micbo1qcDRAFT_167524, partial [Microdochium bolleyi]
MARTTLLHRRRIRLLTLGAGPVAWRWPASSVEARRGTRRQAGTRRGVRAGRPAGRHRHRSARFAQGPGSPAGGKQV